MTRKDYINIAATIKQTRDSYSPNWDSNLFRALNDVSRNLAQVMAEENPRFDKKRFLKACDVPQELIECWCPTKTITKAMTRNEHE